MAHLTVVPRNHAEAVAALKGKRARTIGNNTTLVSSIYSDDITVRLHGNVIVIFHGEDVRDMSGCVTFRNAGWGSVTTRDRLGQFGAAFGLNFGQRKGKQVYFNRRLSGHEPLPFSGSLTVSPEGELVS